MKFFNFPSRQEIQIPHQKARWLIMVISDNIFGNSRQKHNYQNISTFLSRGKPWILIIFIDIFSVSFQFNSWTFLYFSIATYIINARDYFLKDNNKFFYHYLFNAINLCVVYQLSMNTLFNGIFLLFIALSIISSTLFYFYFLVSIWVINPIIYNP